MAGGITRSVSIPQANIFGRVGTGIGQGLAEQLPKEIERGRLASGLEKLSQQQGLTPFQQFSQLASMPGITPQMIQSGSDLLRQQGIAEGFRNASGNAQGGAVRPGPRGQAQDLVEASNQYGNQNKQNIGVRDVATTGPTQAALKPYIPMDLQQLQMRAGELMKSNPQIYPNADLAMQGAVQEDAQNQSISNALQAQRKSQQDVQSTLRNQLKEVADSAGVKIPDNVYQPIEDEAMAEVESGKKTELEAAKDARKKLDKISREYASIPAISSWKGTADMKRSVKSLQKDFANRNDLENFADNLVGEAGLSYPIAYWNAFNEYNGEEVNNIIKNLKPPELSSYKRGVPNPQVMEKQTMETAKQLAPLLKKRGNDKFSIAPSPLAIAQQLKMKGYDPNTFLNYVIDHKDELDLTDRQNRELEKGSTWYPKVPDIFLMYGIGQEGAVN